MLRLALGDTTGSRETAGIRPALLWVVFVCCAGLLLLTAGWAPEGPRPPATVPKPTEKLRKALEEGGPESRVERVGSLRAAGQPVGASLHAVFPRLSVAGRVRALKLIHDHDRPYLQGRWAGFLADTSVGVRALALDLLRESGTPEDLQWLRKTQVPPALAASHRAACVAIEARSKRGP